MIIQILIFVLLFIFVIILPCLFMQMDKKIRVWAEENRTEIFKHYDKKI